MNIDPKIPVDEAIAVFNGNQSALAKALEISRSNITEWVKSDRSFLPTIQAYRLKKLMPTAFKQF